MRALVIAFALMLTGTAHAQYVPPTTYDFSAQTRLFADNAAPEIILRYRNVTLDWIRRDTSENFFKLKLDRQIIALMGSGIDWHVAVNGVACHGSFAAEPSVGFKVYARIRPRLEVAVQFSGMTLGHRGHFTDFESGLKYFPQKNFSLSAGWRRISFKLRRGSEPTSFTLSGPFVGAQYDW